MCAVGAQPHAQQLPRSCHLEAPVIEARCFSERTDRSATLAEARSRSSRAGKDPGPIQGGQHAEAAVSGAGYDEPVEYPSECEPELAIRNRQHYGCWRRQVDWAQRIVEGKVHASEFARGERKHECFPLHLVTGVEPSRAVDRRCNEMGWWRGRWRHVAGRALRWIGGIRAAH